jgi:nucleoid-associated protein YgaU
MAKETKVGLLVGMGIIFLIAWVVGDHLSVVRTQTAPDLTPFADQAQQNIQNTLGATGPGQVAQQGQPGGQAAVGGNGSGAGNTAANVGQTSANQNTGGANTSQVAAGHDAAGDTTGHAIPLPNEAQQAGQRQQNPQPQPGEDSRLARQYEAQRVDDVTGHGTPVSPQGGQDAVRDTRRDDNVGAPRPGPQPQHAAYTVQPGDTLWSISQKYYGDGGRWKAIQEANPTSVAANGSIRPGVRLIIPDKAAVLGPLPPDKAVNDLKQQLDNHAAPPPGKQLPRGQQLTNRAPATNEIRAEKGDTLGGLAQKYLGSATLWPKLLEANRDKMNKPEELREGMVLRLPEGVAKASSAGATSSSAGESRATSSSSNTSRAESARADLPASTQDPAPAARRGAHTYRVKAHQSLQSIAASELGSAARWKDIYQANREQIDDPDRVPAGITLVIP